MALPFLSADNIGTPFVIRIDILDAVDKVVGEGHASVAEKRPIASRAVGEDPQDVPKTAVASVSRWSTNRDASSASIDLRECSTISKTSWHDQGPTACQHGPSDRHLTRNEEVSDGEQANSA